MALAGTPQGHQNKRRFGPGQRCKPQRAVDTEHSQCRVDHAPLRLQNPDPKDRAGDDGHDGRHVEERAVDGDAAYFLVEQQGQKQGDNDVERDEYEHIVERIGHRHAEAPIGGEEFDIVVEADETRRRHDLIVHEPQHKGGRDRAEDEGQKAEAPGEEKEIAGKRLSGGIGEAGLALGCVHFSSRRQGGDHRS